MMMPQEIERKLSELSSRRAGGLEITKPKPKHRELWLAGAVVALALPFVAYYVDTRLLPVSGHAVMVIDPDQAQETGTTTVRFIFEKYRNCKYLGTEFFVVRAGVAEPVQRLKAGPKVTAPVGKMSTGKMVLAVSPDDWINRGMMVAENQCHPLWTHRTRLY